MSEEGGDKVKELVIRRFAYRKGIPYEQALEQYGPLLDAAASSGEEERARLLPPDIVEDLQAIATLSDKLPDESQRYIQMLASSKIEHALTSPGTTGRTTRVEKILERVQDMKVVDKVLEQAFPPPPEPPQAEPQENPRIAQLEKRLEEIMEAVKGTAAEKEAKRLEEILAPVREELAELKTKIEAPAPTKETESIKTIRARIKEAETEAKTTLEAMGYEVPEKAEQEPPKTLEEMKVTLEEMGFEVKDTRISREEALKMIEEASKKAEEEMLDDHRIKAVENIISTAIGRLLDMFSPVVQSYFEGEIQRRVRATAATPPAPPATPVVRPPAEEKAPPPPAREVKPAPKKKPGTRTRKAKP